MFHGVPGFCSSHVYIFYIDEQFISMQGFVNNAWALRVLFKVVLDVKEHVSHGV